MPQFRPTLLSFLIATASISLAPGLLSLSPTAIAAEQESANPEQAKPELVGIPVGKPLQAVPALLLDKKFQEAFDKINEAEAVPNKTSFESYMIARTKIAVAFAARDVEIAGATFEILSASPRFTQAEKIPFIRGMASLYQNAKNYTKSIEWLVRYQKEGGDDPTVRPLLIQLYYANNDFATASKEILVDLQVAETAGKMPAEDQLLMLASCANLLKDKTAYLDTLEKLAAYYPKQKYWTELVNRVPFKPGYAGRLDLDLYRLKFAIGELNTASDYVELSKLALDAGFPAEAKKIAELGFSSSILGVGPDAPKHKRLLEDANKKEGKDAASLKQAEDAGQKNTDGTGLFNVGYAYVTMGQASKGVPLMEQGLSRGGVKRPEDAKLHLAIAYVQNDQKAKAVQMFKTVQGIDGTADLARLWILHLNRVANPTATPAATPPVTNN